MTIRHLKIFITVADCGKMRKAAEILFISQPSVSQAIKEMEKHYGIKLFERLSQRIYITEEGKKLLPYARHIIDSFEKMEAIAFDAAAESRIKIGSSVSVGTVLLPKLTGIMSEKNAETDIYVTVDNTSRIEAMICESELDIAIVEGAVKSKEIVSENICEDELVLVVGKTHTFWKEKEIRPAMLGGQRLISREQGSTDRNQFEQWMTQTGIEMDKRWSCTNTEAIKSAVINGAGAAILSKMLVQKEIENNSMRTVKISGVEIKREIRLIYHKNKYMTKPMQLFKEVCMNFEYDK